MRRHAHTTINCMSPETQRIMSESDRMHKQSIDPEGRGGGDGQSIAEITALSEGHIVAYRTRLLDLEEATQHHDRMLGTPVTGKPNEDKEARHFEDDKAIEARTPSVFLPNPMDGHPTGKYRPCV